MLDVLPVPMGLHLSGAWDREAAPLVCKVRRGRAAAQLWGPARAATLEEAAALLGTTAV